MKFTIMLSRRFLTPDARILLVDDFLAKGQALRNAGVVAFKVCMTPPSKKHRGPAHPILSDSPFPN